MKRITWIHFGAITMAVMLTSPVFAQDTRTQNLIGDYFGFASLAETTAPLELQIHDQLQRRFLGTATLDAGEIAVVGTISSSGNCTIQTDEKGVRISLKLDWLNADGAGVLVGQVEDREQHVAGPVALLRPFEALDVDWGEGDVIASRIVSDVTGSERIGDLEINLGTRGLFAGLALGYVDPEVDLIVAGTSDDRGALVLVGVGSDVVFTLLGQVATGERGRAIAIRGEYLVTTPGGKVLDAGFVEEAF